MAFDVTYSGNRVLRHLVASRGSDSPICWLRNSQATGTPDRGQGPTSLVCQGCAASWIKPLGPRVLLPRSPQALSPSFWGVCILIQQRGNSART